MIKEGINRLQAKSGPQAHQETKTFVSNGHPSTKLPTFELQLKSWIKMLTIH